MSTAYRISNAAYDVELGVYQGEAAMDALTQMSQEAGVETFTEYLVASGVEDAREIVAERLSAPYEMHKVFRDYAPHEREFVERVGGAAGLSLLRADTIRRLVSLAASASDGRDSDVAERFHAEVTKRWPTALAG